MLSFYGGKYLMAAKRLVRPQRDHVVEPFAGSAGFSCFWEPKKVTLIERDPTIYGVWDFLQRSSSRDIRRLPLDVPSIDDLPPRICQEARWLIGFWLNHGIAVPAKTRSNWAQQIVAKNTGDFSSANDDRAEWTNFWGRDVRDRLAHNADRIRHWTIIHDSWENAPDIRDAHWHVDPPYEQAGRSYKFNQVDYTALAKWCYERAERYDGFVEVCEAVGATWLPFKELDVTRSSVGRGRGGARKGYSAEAVFHIGRRRDDFFGVGGQNGKSNRSRVAQGNQGKVPDQNPRRAIASAGSRRQQARRPRLAASE